MTTRSGGAQHPQYDCKARGPAGRRLCRRCLAEVPVGRRTFCSQRCVDEFIARNSQGGFAREVILRDGMVCAICRFDAGKLMRIVDWSRRIGGYAKRGWWGSRDAFILAWLQRLGFQRGLSMIEVDHVVPLAEGGPHDPANGRVLCRPCHRRETAALRARLADKRRRGRTDQQLRLFVP